MSDVLSKKAKKQLEMQIKRQNINKRKQFKKAEINSKAL